MGNNNEEVMKSKLILPLDERFSDFKVDNSLHPKGLFYKYHKALEASEAELSKNIWFYPNKGEFPDVGVVLSINEYGAYSIAHFTNTQKDKIFFVERCIAWTYLPEFKL